MAADSVIEPKLTKCTVCNKAFSVPKLLQCGHQLCRDCLVTLMQSQPQAGCPLCRCVIMNPVQQGGRSVEEVADSFPTDLAMTAMVEAKTLLSKQHMCCVCVNVAAVALCLQCRDMFCPHCKDVHKKQSATSHHDVEDLRKLTVQRLATYNPLVCPVHKDKAADIFCSKHCISVCFMCAFTNHRECPTAVLYQSRVSQLAAGLTQASTMLNQAAAQSDIVIKELDSHMKELHMQSQDAQDQIKITCDRLKAIIDAHLTEACEKISKAVIDVVKKSEELKLSLTNNHCKVLAHKTLTNRYAHFRDHKHFNEMATLISSRLQELDLFPRAQAELFLNQQLKITIDSQAVADIEQEIQHLGQIEISRIAECKPPDLETQKTDMENLMKKPLHEGDSWFLLDVRWFKQWKKYVGYDSWDKIDAGDTQFYPGPIDNSALFNAQSVKSENGGQRLKDQMVHEHDYILLPVEAWNKLVSWYNLKPGQEPIERHVIEQGVFVKHCIVEVYLLDLKLCENSDNTIITKQFSRGATIEDLEEEMRHVFHIDDKKEVRLWGRYMSDTFERLSKKDNTLQDARLYHGQVIVIEQKNADGIWTRKA